MTYRKKTWREKLAGTKGLPKVAPIPEGMGRQWGTGTLVIPAPKEVDRIMRGVPKGKLITIPEIRRILARRHKTTIACPITTGIFSLIAAHAAREALEKGAKRVTPYWRTLKAGGEVNSKYPGGLEDQRKRLKAEGHRVIRKGRRFIVEDYESHLIGS
ncbi:MAG: hypothetical protein AB1512_03425 [Thermodesulfobacteriota bacterium]